MTGLTLALRPLVVRQMGLFKNELRRALRGPWFWGAMILLLVLAVMAAANQISMYVTGWEWIIREFGDESYYYHTVYSCFNMWMPVHDVSDAASLLFTLLPLLVLMGYAWSLAADIHSGYVAQLATRVPRRSLYMARYGAAFISAGLLVAVPLAINFIILACFFPAYTPSVVDSLYIGMSQYDIFSQVFYTLPGLYVVLRLALNFVLCGLWAVMVLAFSTLTTNRIALVCVPYIVLLLVKHVGENIYVAMRLNGYDHFGMSITLFDQLKATPDNFYCYWWATLACALLMLAVSVAVPYLRRRADIL